MGVPSFLIELPPGSSSPSSAPTWSRSSPRPTVTIPVASAGSAPVSSLPSTATSAALQSTSSARKGCWKITRLNPRLVYLALKGYLAGPYEHRPALDKVVQFQTGLAFTGPIGQPLRAGASVIDIMGAMVGIIAA